MKVIDDIISTLSHEARVTDIRVGPFQTAVLTHGCGLASTPRREAVHGEAGPPIKKAGFLIGRYALELAQLIYSDSPMEAAIGMATINSLLEIDQGRCADLNASDLLAQRGKDKKVAVVGHFPFVAGLRKAVEELWVIEKHPGEGDLPEDQAEDLIPRADVVGITASAFTNHTIEHLLSLCRPEAYVVVMGPTSPLSPVLFDYGVDAISGIKVVDTEAALRSASQGATFRQMKGVALLTMLK
ncbi:MAG: DUF364 domain-containing protein [Chloroflexi bacterium]|nr:DUF364 domain-containing protein [Chloroflexota bacterium]